ncbi:hypothetical protein H9Q72_009336 [Fusarium xylarioides]|uniref:Uncharacterized protein n=1 Tax=Fusarium xylarioides TaxID=221167 RepID=A0A9P7HRZ3_9HYPO|nr:hypothetical protein H9Q72_009336 [Fusarium xylarioides]
MPEAVAQDETQHPDAANLLGKRLKRFIKQNNVPTSSARFKFIMKAKATFDTIKSDMGIKLADDLAQFLDNKLHGMTEASLTNIEENGTFKSLPKLGLPDRTTGYRQWFLLACAFGPDHPRLEARRLELSKCWGCHFPTETVIFPKAGKLATSLLFYGKKLNYETLSGRRPAKSRKASPSSPSQSQTEGRRVKRKSSRGIQPEAAVTKNQLELWEEELPRMLELLEFQHNEHLFVKDATTDPKSTELEQLKRAVPRILQKCALAHGTVADSLKDNDLTLEHGRHKELKDIVVECRNYDSLSQHFVGSFLQAGYYEYDDIRFAYVNYKLPVPQWLESLF